jgi:ATP:ADP antiporter, AAA family
MQRLMRSTNFGQGSALLTAMLCAGLVTAQFIAGKATRDALFLAHLNVTSLPAITVATSATSILLVIINSNVLRGLSPAVFVSGAFVLNAVLLLAEWGLTFRAPVIAVVAVYLQISGFGPMLGSGFWLIASERFDPRTAKQRFGQIAGVGTLGGLLGGLLAERIAATVGIEAMLPVLAALNFLCAWHIRRLATGSLASVKSATVEVSTDLAAEATRSGLQVLARAPYLRLLAGIVLLGAIGAGLADYLLKMQAVATFEQAETLLRFFAIYYAATSLITFVVQTSSSRFVLEKFGLSATTATPSAALFLGGLGGLLAPGLAAVTAARAGESVFRNSLFRAGYELFYTPVHPTEKRAAKSIIDVGFDRLGDAVGGGVVRLLLMLAPARQYGAMMMGAMVCSAGALILATRLSRGYMQTLESNLRNRALELDLSETADLTTRTVMLRTISGLDRPRTAERRETANRPPTAQDATVFQSPDMVQIAALRSRDRERIVPVLQNEDGISAALVTHVIPLLAWDPVAHEAMNALRKVAEERVGELTDALIDPNQPFAVRRRLARVLSVCVSQRAVDGLMLGLDDMRFEVRFQCGRSLAAVLEKNPRVWIHKERTFEIVRREVAVSRLVWESHQLLDRVEDAESASMVDQFVRARASRSLAHVFTLLSLVLPAEPLQIAFRGLQTDDQNLRGTALEYLEGVLPPDIRGRLWPYLEDQRASVRTAARPREQILEDLLKSQHSIVLNLEELKRRG